MKILFDPNYPTKNKRVVRHKYKIKKTYKCNNYKLNKTTNGQGMCP